jgi:large subunit ribosomal protein L15
MRLSDLRPAPGSRSPRKRVGRGPGSGSEKTSGRGQKGQKARTGSSIPAYFEGGQNRFSQRSPYLGGFKNSLFRKEFVTINLNDLQHFQAGETVSGETLAAKGLIRSRQAAKLLKVLGDGSVDRALTVSVHKVTASARQQIEAAGGTVSLIEIPGSTWPKTKRAKKTATAEAPATAPATSEA